MRPLSIHQCERASLLVPLVMALLILFAGCGAPLQSRAVATADAPALTAAQLIEIGRAFDQRGDSVRAEQYWMRALEAGAPARAVLPLLLSSYIRDRQYRLAIERAQDYLRRHPRDLDLRLLLGSLHEAIGGLQQAIDEYQRVVERRPAHPDSHYALASALLQQGHDRARADAHFRRYLELAPAGLYAERAEGALMKELTP